VSYLSGSQKFRHVLGDQPGRGVLLHLLPCAGGADPVARHVELYPDAVRLICGGPPANLFQGHRRGGFCPARHSL
jgi:hypothetical protein